MYKDCNYNIYIMRRFFIIHPSQEGWTEFKYYLLHPTSMGHKQTPGYHKTRVLNKVRLFDRFQSKDLELDHFEMGSCAVLLNRVKQG